MTYIHRHERHPGKQSQLLGEALLILLNSKRKAMAIGTIGAFVLPFAKLSQIDIFYGYNGFPAGYMTWGNLEISSLNRLRENPYAILDIDELNAGCHLVIFDMISNLRDFTQFTCRIKELSRGKGELFGLRMSRKAGGIKLIRYAERLDKEGILTIKE